MILFKVAIEIILWPFTSLIPVLLFESQREITKSNLSLMRLINNSSIDITIGLFFAECPKWNLSMDTTSVSKFMLYPYQVSV